MSTSVIDVGGPTSSASDAVGPTKRKAPGDVGIEERHTRGCPAKPKKSTARCRCSPSYRGMIYDNRIGRTRKGPWLPTKAAARAWRTDQARKPKALVAAPTFDDFWARVVAGMKDGSVRNRSGEVYKPSTIEGYEQSYDLRIGPMWGQVPLDIPDAPAFQRWVRALLGEGSSASTIHNQMNVIRVIYREAVSLGDVLLNPTRAVRLPASRGRRLVVIPADVANRMLAVLTADVGLWAFAFYTGLRRGELAALRGTDIDLDKLVINVERAYCFKSKRFLEPKSASGHRVVPITAELLPYAILAEQAGDGLAFGRTPDRVMQPKSIQNRANRAWSGAGFTKVTLHNCRHTFASYLIAAGVNAKAVTIIMGHSSIQVTFDLYGHLFPGAEDEARELLDAFLAESARKTRAGTGARRALKDAAVAALRATAAEPIAGPAKVEGGEQRERELALA